MGLIQEPRGQRSGTVISDLPPRRSQDLGRPPETPFYPREFNWSYDSLGFLYLLCQCGLGVCFIVDVLTLDMGCGYT